VPRLVFYLIALILLAVPLALSIFHHVSFEATRWKESDHPMITESTDD
jgi:hypothetical protein